MKISTPFIIVASALIGLAGTSMPLYAQEADNIDVFSMCSKETKHSTLYDYGKKLAEGWVYRTKTEAKEEKKYPVKTKNSFFTRAMLGYTKKYKIADTNIVYFCYMGYNTVIKEVPWSSVHQGLVDYLPAQSKSKFLSLPER
jgi:hypothetical protein